MMHFLGLFREKDGVELLSNERVIMASPDGLKQTLIMKKVELNEGGRYAVKAVNVAGELLAGANLTVNGTTCNGGAYLILV